MIQDGDKIAIGVSGGKDSMTLLTALASLRRYYPKNFEITAVTLDMGIGNFDTDVIRRYCESLDVSFNLEQSNIGKIIFDVRKEKNPCSLCANMRRGALHSLTTKLECNKLAFAHNYEDTIETLLMSLFYEGRTHLYSPVTYLDRRDITLIRPMIYVWEADIKAFVKEKNIQLVKNECPANGKTARQDMKELIANLEQTNPYIRSSIFHAIRTGGFEGWK